MDYTLLTQFSINQYHSKQKQHLPSFLSRLSTPYQQIWFTNDRFQTQSYNILYQPSNRLPFTPKQQFYSTNDCKRSGMIKVYKTLLGQIIQTHHFKRISHLKTPFSLTSFNIAFGKTNFCTVSISQFVRGSPQLNLLVHIRGGFRLFFAWSI